MESLLKVNAKVKAAWIALQETVQHPVSIMQGREMLEVHVLGLKSLDKIPGEIKFKEHDGRDKYSHEAYRDVEGVRYFCMITREQYNNQMKRNHKFWGGA